MKEVLIHKQVEFLTSFSKMKLNESYLKKEGGGEVINLLSCKSLTTKSLNQIQVNDLHLNLYSLRTWPDNVA